MTIVFTVVGSAVDLVLEPMPPPTPLTHTWDMLRRPSGSASKTAVLVERPALASSSSALATPRWWQGNGQVVVPIPN